MGESFAHSCVVTFMLALPKPLTGLAFLTPAVLLAAIAPAAAAREGGKTEPLSFFEGRTEMLSTIKVVTKKPYRSRTLGRGQILPDGSLALLQQVQEDGKPPLERRWRIRRVADGRFQGTMSDAAGPVTVQEVNGKYQFRFKIKGGLDVDQWLTPQAGGRIAHSRTTVKKFGIRVATSEGTIRKL
jgi:hypothetical protein